MNYIAPDCGHTKPDRYRIAMVRETRPNFQYHFYDVPVCACGDDMLLACKCGKPAQDDDDCLACALEICLRERDYDRLPRVIDAMQKSRVDQFRSDCQWPVRQLTRETGT